MAVKQTGGARRDAPTGPNRLEPYFKRILEGDARLQEFEYGEADDGDGPAFEIRAFDDTADAGQLKVQFWQLGRRRKCATLTCDGDDPVAMLTELIDDLTAFRDSL